MLARKQETARRAGKREDCPTRFRRARTLQPRALAGRQERGLGPACINSRRRAMAIVTRTEKTQPMPEHILVKALQIEPDRFPEFWPSSSWAHSAARAQDDQSRRHAVQSDPRPRRLAGGGRCACHRLLLCQHANYRNVRNRATIAIFAPVATATAPQLPRSGSFCAASVRQVDRH